MSCLPFPEAARIDPFAELERRAPRIANAVQATTRRRDVRERRAQLVLLLLSIACPLGRRPARAWYEPGAVARKGAAGIRSAWEGYWGEEPPSLRTIRSYLGELEAACVLIRAPGDWLPIMRDPDHPERRPRYPDTLHLLRGDAAAEWWAGPGRQLLERHPDARCNPDRWRMVFGSWRERAGNRQLELELLSEAPPPKPPATRGPGSRATVSVEQAQAQLEDAATITAALRCSTWNNPLDFLLELARAGCRITGGNQARLLREPELLRGAAAMLAAALRRGDRIRNRAGWVVRMTKHAPRAELAAALNLGTRTAPAGAR